MLCPVYSNKRYLMIDPQIARHFVHYSECLSNPLPFKATQIINPFLDSRFSANNNKGFEFQPIVKSLYSLMFFQCRISFMEKSFLLYKVLFVEQGIILVQSPGVLYCKNVYFSSKYLNDNFYTVMLLSFILPQKINAEKNYLNFDKSCIISQYLI